MKHPVRGAYALADLSKPCGNCRAPEYANCTHPDGTPRRVPCLPRLTKLPDPYTAERPYDQEHGA